MKAIVNNANQTIASSGLATEAKQDTMITDLDAIKTAVELIDNAVAGSELQVDVVSSALPSGASTEATLSSLLTELQGKADLAETQPVSAASLPLPTGAATEATLGAIQTAVEILDNIVSGSEAQVDVLTLPAIPAGANSIGTVGLDAGSNLAGYMATAAVAGSSNATSIASSTALEASHVIKASAGRLYSLVITNTKAASQFIQIHNTSSVPADTAVPVYSFYVPAASSVSIAAEDLGDYFSTGISVCNSSTAATKTIGSADCFFTARYL